MGVLARLKGLLACMQGSLVGWTLSICDLHVTWLHTQYMHAQCVHACIVYDGVAAGTW